MAYRHSAVSVKQKLSKRLSDEVRAPYYDRVFALERNIIIIEKFHNPVRRASNEAVAPRPESALLHVVATVNVFVGVDEVEKRIFVEVLRKRKLQNHTRYVGILVEITYCACNLVESAFGRKFAKKRLYAHFVARFDFVANVHLRRGIVANKNNRKTDSARTTHFFEIFNVVFDLFSRDFCNEFAVDNLHSSPLCRYYTIPLASLSKHLLKAKTAFYAFVDSSLEIDFLCFAD